MNNSLLNRRIPTLFAFVMLVGGIVFAMYLANTTLRITSQASPDEKPQNIRITNITDTSFTVTYTTSKSVFGTLSYGTTQPLTQIARDDRDGTSPASQAYTTHSITAKNLSPQTKYLFSITSGSSTFLDNTAPFQVTTGTKISDTRPKKEVSGSVSLPDGKAAPNTLIYITTNGAQVLSTTTNSQGAFVINVAPLRTANLQALLELTDETRMNLIAVKENQISQVTFLLLDPTIAPITLSQNYDFTLGRTILLPDVASESATAQFPIFEANPAEEKAVGITTPTQNERFTDQQPTFSGTGSPNADITISIQPGAIEETVQVSDGSNWTYRPQSPLNPGEYTIKITSRDNRNVLRTVTKSFIVLAQGSQFTEPSVSPNVSPTSQPTLTATTIPSPTPTTPAITLAQDTPTLAPTETILIPTFEPSPTVTPQPTIQPTGSSTLNTISIASFAFIVFGVILLLFTKGISL